MEKNKLLMSQVNSPLLELFRAHGVEAAVQDECIVFPGQPIKANASIEKKMEKQGSISVQLGVRFEITPLQVMVESFAGLGETLEKATTDAWNNFTTNSFHVFLAAFFKQDD